ncbi:MAG: serine/threonine-protein kinase [Planctomycetota bacterium]
MGLNRAQQVETLFLAASELEACKRAEFLEKACGGDTSLQAEIEELLAAHEQAGDLMEVPALALLTSLPPEGVGEARVGHKVGPFQIVRVIASGGMGVVYEATQEHPHRTVALKMMRTCLPSKTARRRFEYEAEILGRLHHPFIAQVYEAGTYEYDSCSIPYFAMEYLPEARPIIEYATSKSLGTRKRVELFGKVCEAIHYGHQQGVIHRDLKPSNILVDAAGMPKVIDFGVARTTNSDLALTTLQTDVGQLVGTLQYMSPEQCDADPKRLDTRSDVYSLGVVLYELLSGELPYDVRHVPLAQAACIIREQMPRRLSAIRKALRGDLETIVRKALEKDKERRYGSAEDLAQDLSRYLKHQPIEARPPSAVYQLRKMVARHRAAFALLAVLMVLLVVFGISMTVLSARARREAAQARREADTAQQILGYVVGLIQAIDPTDTSEPDLSRGQALTARDILEWSTQKVFESLADQPRAQAMLLSTLGMVYRGLGLGERAAELFQTGLDIRQELYGGDHAEILDSLRDLAVITQYQGNLARAEELRREALAMSCRLFGEVHLEVAEDHFQLAALLRVKEQYGEAEVQYRQALGIRQQLLGPEHVDVAYLQWQLAGLLQLRGDHEEAKKLCRGALEMTRRLVGEEHVAVSQALVCLASILLSGGSYTEAETHYREALAMRCRLLGNEHVLVADVLVNLASLQREQERYDQAEASLEEALAIVRRLVGEGHPSVANVFYQWGALRQVQGRTKEAEAQYQRALEILRGSVGEEHLQVANVLSNLAALQKGQRRYKEAEENYQDALAILRQLFGEEHPQVAVVLYNLGHLRQEEGRHQEAEAQYREMLGMARRLVGKEHPLVADVLVSLASLQREQGRYEEAEANLQEALLIVRGLFTEEHPRVTRVLYNLAFLRQAQGRPEEVEALVRERLAVLKKDGAELPLEFTETLRLLARVKYATGCYDEAEALHREVLSIQRRVLGEDHPDVGATLYDLAQALLAEGDREALQALYEQALALHEKVIELPEEDPRRSGFLLLLGELRLGQGDPEGAEAYLRGCVEIRRKVLPEGDRLIAYAESVLGNCLTALGRHDEAEELLLGSFPVIEKLYGPSHPTRTQEAMRRIVALYEAWGKPAQAQAWRGRLISSESSDAPRQVVAGGENDGAAMR